MNNNIRLVDINDGSILWEGTSKAAAIRHAASLVDYWTRHGDRVADMRVKQYIGDGEWESVWRNR